MNPPNAWHGDGVAPLIVFLASPLADECAMRHERAVRETQWRSPMRHWVTLRALVMMAHSRLRHEKKADGAPAPGSPLYLGSWPVGVDDADSLDVFALFLAVIVLFHEDAVFDPLANDLAALLL